LARRLGEAAREAEQSEWQEIEDGFSHRKNPFAPSEEGAGTKDA
jgi:hypothetical protein